MAEGGGEVPGPDLVTLPTRRSMARGEGGRCLEVGKGRETGADVADGVRAGGGIGGVDDEVSTLVAGEAIGGETAHFHGDPQTEGAEVAGEGTDNFVVPVLGAGGEAFLAAEGVVT